MKHYSLHFVISLLLIPLFITPQVHSRIEKNYVSMMVVDGETFEKTILDWVRPIAAEQLNAKERDQNVIRAIRYLFSREDQDGFRNIVFSKIKKNVEDEGVIQKSVSTVAMQSVEALQNSKSSAVELSTHIVILQNIIEEIRPELGKKRYRNLFTKIKNSQLTVPKSVRKDRKKRGLRPFISPSKLASQLLK